MPTKVDQPPAERKCLWWK